MCRWLLLATLMWISVLLLRAVEPHALLCYVTLCNSFRRLEIWRKTYCLNVNMFKLERVLQ